MSDINLNDLQQLIIIGEDSRRQFKRDFTNADSLAAEMVAFANGNGGTILIGINDNATIAGLSVDDVRRLNQLISNVASQNVRPAINPTTQNIVTDKGTVIVLTIPNGTNKPYQDKDGVFWVKSGADKRKATASEEIKRMFTHNESLHADEQAVFGTSIDDLDLEYFTRYFDENYKTPLNKQSLPIKNLLHNLKILKDDTLSLTGALLFGKDMEHRIPLATVKAVTFVGNSMGDTQFIDKREITGKMIDIYREAIAFFHNNLRLVQVEEGFNTPGQLEIPLAALQELVVNALIHRDFFVPANIRLMIFRNRIEITSPGHLPNTLTTESIKYGISAKRNSLLSSFAIHILPYNGIGTGITRALEAYPHITFEDDRIGNQFKVTIARPEIGV
ncbi:transcriptional regulator [Spirochaetia bacterium]|nr:transcriptional regulator [Spirochaetia bacterium]